MTTDDRYSIAYVRRYDEICFCEELYGTLVRCCSTLYQIYLGTMAVDNNHRSIEYLIITQRIDRNWEESLEDTECTSMVENSLGVVPRDDGLVQLGGKRD